MDKKKPFSFLLARWRGLVQACAALLTNLHLPNFLKGTLYRGAGKTVCVPGLNCYSCPGAAGACPIGSFQAVVGSSKFSFSYYITGILILLGVLLGRFICGFLCPFGWFQELLHKIPTKKLSTKRLKPLTYLKYVILVVMVFLLPVLVVNEAGMGRSWHGRPVLLQISLPAGRARRRYPALACQQQHPRRARQALFVEALRARDSRRAQRRLLPPVLQVALPARRVLRTLQPRVAAVDAR